ncbi:unnamed protein product [Lota lota]
MPRDKSGLGGEEAVFQSATIEDQWRQDASSGHQSGGLRGRGKSGGGGAPGLVLQLSLSLNLLQEELPKPSEVMAKSLHEHHIPGVSRLSSVGPQEGDAPSGSGNHDDQPTSSELLDLLLLLQEDARSGTGSNAMGSGSGESGGSLGSGEQQQQQILCQQRLVRHVRSPEAAAEHQHLLETRVQDSLWSMIQHTPEPVMMAYQIHTRDQQEVLAEDMEKLRVMQPLQPWFTQEQREELAKVHPLGPAAHHTARDRHTGLCELRPRTWDSQLTLPPGPRQLLPFGKPQKGRQRCSGYLIIFIIILNR